MNTFTAQELADFYQQVADGGEIQVESIHPPKNQPAWGSTKHSPSLVSDPAMWRIKPKKKVVDLSVLIASGIDCVFTGKAEVDHVIDRLVSIDNSTLPFGSMNTGIWSKCRPRMNHVHAWQGGECPLPEGLLVKVWYRRMGFAHISSSDYIDDWRHDGDYDTNIIAFEVLGLADGYCWPFEE